MGWFGRKGRRVSAIALSLSLVLFCVLHSFLSQWVNFFISFVLGVLEEQ
jgi:hypothetical protein